MNSILGLVEVAGHYYMNFIDTLLNNNVCNSFHNLIGILLNDPDKFLGYKIIFIGPPRTGKTTICKILYELFKNDDRFIFFDGRDPKKIDYPDRISFMESNQHKEYFSNMNHAFILYMSGITFPENVYRRYMNDLKVGVETYRYTCDMIYHARQIIE